MFRRLLILTLAAALVAGAPEALAQPEPGDKAPAVKVKEWINAPKGTSWSSFSGKVILLELWATW